MILILSIFTLMDVFYSVPDRVEAALPGWNDEIRLTDSPADIWGIDVAVSGIYVHVVWSDNNDICYKRSSDNGRHWNNTLKLTNSGYNHNPYIACFGHYIHVVWENGNDGSILYIQSTDNGESWENPISWGGSPFPGYPMDIIFWPHISVNANNVYIVANNDYPSQIIFRRSHDSGITWTNWTMVGEFGWPFPWCSIDVTSGMVHVTAGYMGGGSLRWIDHYFSNDDGDTWYENMENPIVSCPTWEEILTNYQTFSVGEKYSLYYSIMDLSGLFHIGTFEKYCYDSDPESWGGSVQMLANGEGHFDVDDSHFVWGELDANNHRQLHSSKNGPITYYSSNSHWPILEISGGIGHVVWEDDRHGSWDIFYTQIGTASLTVSPSPPIADAGPDQIVSAGELVLLEGSKSYDPDTCWRVFTLDAHGDSGNHSSIAVDSNGNPHISYHNYIPPEPPPCGDPLKYAVWDGSSWTLDIVDDQGFVGTHTYIALDGNDIPHISYCDDTNWNLKYAKKNATGWDIETVDSWPTGEHSSIALDNNGYPHIAYDDDQERAVKYARKDATGWTTEIMCKGTWASLDIDSSGNPHISLIDMGVLKYASWTGTTWDIEVVGSERCEEDGTSLVLDKNDYPHITYFEESTFDLKYARWDGSQWIFDNVDSIGDVSAESSLALDPFDDPHICYSDGSELKYARKTTGNWIIDAVNNGVGFPGRTISLAIGTNDIPQISYYNSVSQDLLHGYKRNDIVSYDWDFGDGSPNGSGRKVSHIYNSRGVYVVTLTVVDIGGNVDTDTCIITVRRSVNLENGWNLISLPAIQTSTDIETVLQSIEGKYDSVQWYDASDTSDPWKHSQVSKPANMNDLTDLDHTKGFKIHVTDPDDMILGYSGVEPTSNQTITLYKGWNMVGYPSLSNRYRPDALNNLVFGSEVDAVWTYNSGAQKWEEVGDLNYFVVGKGYWIHTTQGCVWEVPV
jgi:hypothetical protein